MAKKALPWFRLYTEFSTDHKVQMMTESMQRRLVMLFCMQREDTLNSMSEGEICYRLGVSKKEWLKTKKLFEEKGFKNGDDEIKNGQDFMRRFALRQFDSDDSAERKRKYRENLKLKDVCPNDVPTNGWDMSQRCPVLDTDTDTDTDTEEKELLRNSCSEAKKNLASDPSENLSLSCQEIFISIPLVDGSEFPVSEKILAQFEECYPAVNVRQELRKIRGWNLSRPKKRKTKRGIMGHINSWLSKEQDKGHAPQPNLYPQRVNNVVHNQLVLEKIIKEEDDKLFLESDRNFLEEKKYVADR